MNDRSRPLSITIISWIFIIAGCIAFVSGLWPMVNATGAQRVAHFQKHWMVHLLHLAQIVGGVFLLSGHNWARWLLVVWMAVHIVISVLHSLPILLFHVAVFSVILFFLFRRPASAFFSYRIPTSP